jgi:ubiquinone/menaquinone biosynthesis C-methylase UbiE
LVGGSAERLPFADGAFAAILSINTIHNLVRADARRAIAEIERLAPGRGYIQVDSYRTLEQREIFLSWVLTAKFHDYPEGWIQLFREAGYTGDWNWTIVE